MFHFLLSKKKLFYLTFFPLFLLTILFIFRHPILGTFISKQIVEQVKKKIGLDISIATVSGNYFSNLELRNIKTLGGYPKSIITSVNAGKIAFRYSLFSMFAGLDSFLDRASFILDNVDVQLDTSDTSSENKYKQETPKDSDFFLPAAIPGLFAHNISVHINTQKGKIEFNDITAISNDINNKQSDTYILDIKTQKTIIPHPAFNQAPIPLSFRLHYSPKAISIKKLRMAEEIVADLINLDLSDYQNSKFPVKAEMPLFEGKVQINGKITDQRIEVAIELDRVNLNDPPSFFKKPEFPLAGMISGRSELDIDFDKPVNVNGSLKLTLQSAKIQDILVDLAELTATAVNGNISIQKFTIKNEGTFFSINEAKFALKPIVNGKAKNLFSEAEANLFLNTKDLPQLFTHIEQSNKTTEFEKKLPEHKLQITALLKKGGLIIEAGKFTTETASILMKYGKITFPPIESGFKKSSVQSELEFKINDLSEMSELFDLPAMTGSLSGNADIKGTVADLNGIIFFTGKDVKYAEWKLGEIQTSAKIADGIVYVDPFIIEQDQNIINGIGSYRIADTFIKGIHLSIKANEPSFFTKSDNSPSFPFHGKISAEIDVSGFLSDPEITFEAQIKDGQYKGYDIAQGDLSLFNKGRLLTIRKAQIVSEDGHISLTGYLGRNKDNTIFDLGLKTFIIRRKEAEIELLSPGSISIDTAGKISIDQLDLKGNVGRIEANGLLEKSGQSNLKIIVTDFFDKGWFEAFTGENIQFNDADATLLINGDMTSPLFTLDGSIKEIGNKLTPTPFTAVFKLEYSDQQLQFNQFSLKDTVGNGEAEISGHLPFSIFNRKNFHKGELDLVAKFQLPDLQSYSIFLPDEPKIKGSLNGNILLSGSWEKLNGLVQLNGENVRLPYTWKFIPSAPLNVNCDIDIKQDIISIRTMKFSSQPLSFDVSGKWHNPPSLISLINKDTSLLTGSFDINSHLETSDISWVAKDIEGIRRIDGQIIMETSLTGAANNPEIVGKVKLTQGELRSNYDIPAIREMNFEAVVDTDQIEITSLHGEIGGAPFSTIGEITDYRSTNPQIDVSLQGENLLLFRSADAKVRSDVDLEFSGMKSDLNVKGELAITDGKFTRNFDFISLFRQSGDSGSDVSGFLFSFQEPPFNNAKLQIKISSKKPFRLKNNLANGSFRPDFLLAGTGELPVIKGNIYLNPLKIKIPSGIINMESGLIRFSETDPDRPELDMTGKAKIMGYDITILIHGPSDEPTVTLSSSPPLPDDELLLLLLTGKIPQKTTDSKSAWKGGMNVALYLGKDILTKWFNATGDEADESILDRFELEIGRGVTRLGEQTIEGQFRLAERVFRKNDILFMTAEKDIYDAFNSGLKIVFQFK